MARAYKCDFCGRLYESEHTQSVTIAIPKPGNVHVLQIVFHHIFGEKAEICEACYEKTLKAYNEEVIEIYEKACRVSPFQSEGVAEEKEGGKGA